MTRIWFNEGYSGIRDAVQMIGEARGADLHVLASHRDPCAPVLDVADRSWVEPAIDRRGERGRAAYVEYCLEMCRIHAVDLFVVQRGRTDMAERREEFERIGTRIALTGSAETLRLVDDKGRFFDAACAADIPMPWTREIADVAAFDSACAELSARGKAACVKPPHGVFGAGFWRLDPLLSLFDTFMNAENHCVAPAAMRSAISAASPGFRLLVLEYLPGDEWSLDCICREGRLVVGVARRKLGRAQRIEVEGPIFEIARRAVAAFGLSGLINLQFKAAGDSDEDVRLLEINLRMSGGCLYTRYSGVNLPWWHVALELGLAEEGQIPVPTGGAMVAAVGEAHLIKGQTQVLTDA